MSKKSKPSFLTILVLFFCFSLFLSGFFILNKKDNSIDNSPRIELTDSSGNEVKYLVFND